MKLYRLHLPQLFAAAIAITLFLALAGRAAIEETCGDLPHAVQFELGDAAFAHGDNITINQVRGTSETIANGGTYCVEGTYTLASRDQADLAFFTTTITDSGPSPIDPRQHVRIKKGTGSFRLVKTLNKDGYLHLSFYPVLQRSDDLFSRNEFWFPTSSQLRPCHAIRPIYCHPRTGLTSPAKAFCGRPSPTNSRLQPASDNLCRALNFEQSKFCSSSSNRNGQNRNN